jgi:hypothetical protein
MMEGHLHVLDTDGAALSRRIGCHCVSIDIPFRMSFQNAGQLNGAEFSSRLAKGDVLLRKSCRRRGKCYVVASYLK